MAHQRRVEEKCLGNKKKTLPVALVVQPQPVQAHYSQPQVHFKPVEPCQKPQVNYQQVEVYHQNNEAVHPLKSLCSRSEFGADNELAAMVNNYPSVFQTVETNRFINDLPITRTVDMIAPYDDGILAARKGFGGRPRTVIRPTPLMTPSIVRANTDGQYVDYDTGVVPEVILGYQELRAQPAGVMPQIVRIPGTRRNYDLGQFNTNFNRLEYGGYAILPESQGFRRLLINPGTQKPDVSIQKTLGPMSSGNDDDAHSAEQPMESIIVAQNVQQSSDAPSKSDSKDNNNTKPAEQNKIERFTRN